MLHNGNPLKIWWIVSTLSLTHTQTNVRMDVWMKLTDTVALSWHMIPPQQLGHDSLQPVCLDMFYCLTYYSHPVLSQLTFPRIHIGIAMLWAPVALWCLRKPLDMGWMQRGVDANHPSFLNCLRRCFYEYYVIDLDLIHCPIHYWTFLVPRDLYFESRQLKRKNEEIIIYWEIKNGISIERKQKRLWNQQRAYLTVSFGMHRKFIYFSKKRVHKIESRKKTLKLRCSPVCACSGVWISFSNISS